MAKSNTSASDINKLIYNATAIANIADNAATSPLANIFIAAHTAEPGAAGTQSTSEAAYTGYARASVARTTGGFTDASGVLSLVADASFGACTAGGPVTLTHWSTGVASSGATKILHRGVFGSRQGPFTAIAATDAITIPGHTFSVNDQCAFYAPSGTTMAAGITEGTVYFVKTVSGNDITISTTQGGATLDITAAGDGLAYKVTPITVNSGVTPKLAAGQIIFEE